jgi:CBS domain-containing protein
MNTITTHKGTHCPFDSLRAKDMMTPNPVSIRRDAGIREALELMTDRGFGAAPVIDEAGRPIGVVSRTDILIHERECVRHARLPDDASSPYDWSDWDMLPERALPEGFSIEVADRTSVGEIMTPAIFTVPLEAPAREVVRRMRELKVHHLFVVDADLAVVGVISPLDVIRHLED